VTTASAWIADRYELLRVLGRGGHGDVWEATDHLLGASVAIKLLDAGAGEPARIRREVAALRLLRLPGVVRLIDEGFERGIHFVVMERVEGLPFPGKAPRGSWAALAGPTVRLLQTLGRIHAAGIIHRDLKPDNVLVDAAGEPTVLDFGLSHGGALGGGLTPGDAVLGSPAYLAPEQILGRAVSAETDLYALGVMLYESLSGRSPHPGDDFPAIMRARLTQAAPPLHTLAPGTPEVIARLVDRLLARAPADRPRSADEILDAIHDVRARTGASAPRPTTEPDLVPLFAGPNRLFHLGEDAARELWIRSAGAPERCEAELDSWLRAGFVRRDGDLLVIDRDTLDYLEEERLIRAASPELPAARRAGAAPRATSGREAHRAAAEALLPGAPGRLFHLIAGQDDGRGGGDEEIAAEAVEMALPLAHAGKLGRAVAVLAESLRAARSDRARPRSGEARLLGVWVQIALSDGAPRALDRVLYEICRSEERGPEIRGMEALVRAALVIRTAADDRALALLDASVAPCDDPELDRFRQHLRVLAARRGSAEREAEVLAEVADWAAARGDEEAEQSLADWLGRLRYRQGRFAEAAELHACAATQGRWVTARIGAMLNQASALMETFSFDAAREAASSAQQLARRCRLPYLEARAEWILRTIAYRSGESGAPDLELVELVARVGIAFLEGAVCLTEAAAAWRAGQPGVASSLAQRAALILSGRGREAGALLARALELVAGGTPGERGGELAREAARCPIPGVELQALGLICAACPELCPELRGRIHELASTIPRQHWQARMDLLSVEEALAAGEGTLPRCAEAQRS
jgi:hypothetical protein